MNLVKKVAFTILLTGHCCFAAVVAQEELATEVGPHSIEERFQRQSVLASGALDQMMHCNSTVPRNRYEDLIETTRKGQLVSGLLGQAGDAKVVGVAAHYWTCISFTSQGYAILPVEVLQNTVVTIGASRTGLTNWRRQLLAELALRGKAQGLIETVNGSAELASYTLTSEGGLHLSYETTWLKPGSYKRGDYKIVIAEPTISSVSVVHVGQTRSKDRSMLLAPLQRVPLTSEGFIPIVGSAATAVANFSGSVWKFESVFLPGGILRLNPQGLAIYEMSKSSQTGQWKVVGNVLRVYFNTDIYYSLALTEDGRFLQGEVRRKQLPRSNVPGIPSIPQHDDFDPDLRFKVDRLYRESDSEYETKVADKRQVAKQQAVGAVQMLFARAEERKRQILIETPEREAAEEAKVFGRSERTEYTWRVCDNVLYAELINASMSSSLSASEFVSKSVGEVCYAWFGARKTWKTIILMQGCNKRCAVR